jgi:hypothetical protein
MSKHDTSEFFHAICVAARDALNAGACPGCVAKSLACLAVTIAQQKAGITADDFLAEIAREEREAADDDRGGLH